MRIPFRSFAVGLALSTVAGAAQADVMVTGTVDNMRIEARRAPIIEVMEALKRQFGFFTDTAPVPTGLSTARSQDRCSQSCLGFSGTGITLSGSKPIIR